MRTFFKTMTAIGIALAVPIAAYPTESQAAAALREQSIHYKTISGKATALAPTPDDPRSAARMEADGFQGPCTRLK
jgi:hypothetical protein